MGLWRAGAKIRAYDPIAMAIASQSPREGVRYCGDEYEAASGADALGRRDRVELPVPSVRTPIALRSAHEGRRLIV